MNNSIFEISVIAVITAIFKMLVPEERQGKQIKLLISCFFIVTVLNLFDNFPELNIIDEFVNTGIKYNDYSVIYEKQTADEIANQLRKKIFNELKKVDIHPEKIYIDINISESSSISISKIRLVFTDKNSYEAERAVKITEMFTGYEILVEAEVW